MMDMIIAPYQLDFITFDYKLLLLTHISVSMHEFFLSFLCTIISMRALPIVVRWSPLFGF